MPERHAPPEAVTPAPSRRADALRASPPLFASPLLDRLTRVHHLVPPLLFGPVVVVLLVSGARAGLGAATVAWVAFGYLLWTLTEYWLHRVVFHFEPEGALGRRLHYLVHGVHHDHPNDPRRLVMPPSASIPLAALFCAFFFAVFGDPRWRPVAGGFLSGYLVYDMLHYVLHHYVPRGRLGRALRERHMRHHFQDDTRGFGVSAPYWDVVFGTPTISRREARAARVAERKGGDRGSSPRPQLEAARHRASIALRQLAHRRG